MRLSYFFCFLFMGCVHFSFPQTASSELNTLSDRAASRARKVYVDFFHEQMQLYNGTKYDEVLRNPEIDRGHRFFLTENLIHGDIQYGGVAYSDVQLQYDIVTDQIITVLPNTSYKISLIKNLVSEFILQDHRFIHLEDKGIASGFYEILLDGKIKVFVKRTKRISESYYNHNLFVKRNYSEKNELYVLVDKTFYLIKGKKSLQQIFNYNKQDFSAAIRYVNTSFKREKEQYVVQFVEFYNNLN